MSEPDIVPWDHQVFAVQQCEVALETHSRVLVSIPTGGGKTWVAAELIRLWVARGLRVGIYTNRRLLVAQLSRMMDGYGIDHGVMASGRERAEHHAVQICSIQTQGAAKRKAKKMSAEAELPDFQRVIIDEAHLNANGEILDIMAKYAKAGAKIVGLTATPIDLAHAYDVLVQSGTASELRACGALVEAIHFGPDEPDFKAFKKLKKSLANCDNDGAELTEGQVRDLIMTPSIFGRVWEWFEKLNPEHEPTILFAPGVKESYWFAQQFAAKGVTSAHLDGTNIWRSGWDEPQRTTPTLRREVLDGSRDGRIAVLCNRFVLREGIDAPWLSHGIFATIFGSLQTYLQSGGRLLRSHPEVSLVRIQDHGGNWWRWGSLNADRHWNLSDTGSYLAQRRADRLRDKKDAEPFRCPECARILIAGRCVGCGWTPGVWLKARPVVSTNGELRLMKGDIYRARPISKARDGPKKWARIFWASRKYKPERTFRVAFVIFAKDNWWQWPSRSWPWMPIDPEDVYRPCADVPLGRLVQPVKGDDDGGRSEGNDREEARPEWEEEGLFAGDGPG